MQDLTYVTYCGLYCKLCDNLAQISLQASTLHKTLQKGGWKYFGPDLISGFKEFWAVLEQLSQVDPNFKGCRGGKCGNPDCSIRKCAQSRQVELCPSCEANLIGDGRRQQEVGCDQWIQEQEQRCKTGFCYCDIRYDT